MPSQAVDSQVVAQSHGNAMGTFLRRPLLYIFSALLHQADSWLGCGLGREFWETKTLWIPAKVGFFRQ